MIDPQYLFDFGEKSVEVLVLGTVVFSQSGLHQTPEAKSVVNPHYTATVRALVVLVLGVPNESVRPVKSIFYVIPVGC